MSDTFAILLCILAAGIIAAYYFRIKRTTKLLSDGKPDQSLKNRWLRWSDRVVIAAAILLVIGFFLLRSVFVLWISLSVLIVALILGQILKISK